MKFSGKEGFPVKRETWGQKCLRGEKGYAEGCTETGAVYSRRRGSGKMSRGEGGLFKKRPEERKVISEE